MAFNVSEQTLRALQIAERSFPIHDIAVAAGAALSIVEIIQMIKSNKEGFIAIGRDSCLIVEAILKRVRVDQNGRVLNDPATLRHTDVLVADMRYVEGRVRKAKERSGLKKIFSRHPNQNVIRDCRARLMQAMTLFSFQQLTSVHNLLITTYEALPRPLSPRTRPEPQRQIPSSMLPPTLPPQPQVPSMYTTQFDQSGPPPRPQLLQVGAQQRAAEDQGRTNEVTQQQTNMMPSSWCQRWLCCRGCEHYQG